MFKTFKVHFVSICCQTIWNSKALHMLDLLLLIVKCPFKKNKNFRMCDISPCKELLIDIYQSCLNSHETVPLTPKIFLCYVIYYFLIWIRISVYPNFLQYPLLFFYILINMCDTVLFIINYIKCHRKRDMLVKWQRYRAALLPLPLMFLPKALSKKYRRLVDKNNQSKPPTQKKKIEGKNKSETGKLPQVYGVDYRPYSTPQNRWTTTSLNSWRPTKSEEVFSEQSLITIHKFCSSTFYYSWIFYNLSHIPNQFEQLTSIVEKINTDINNKDNNTKPVTMHLFVLIFCNFA